MAPYNPMKKHMDKLDEWGSAQAKRLNVQRDAGSGVSMSDRLNMARGRDTRWENSKRTNAADETDDADNIVPDRSARVGHLPPAPPSMSSRSAVAAARPPPPPLRNGSGPPPPPARSSNGNARPPPPALPRRMDNESGTSNPPPPYPVSSDSNETGIVEFSKFDQEDKEAFFDLLDEYFASRAGTRGKSSRRAAAIATSSSSFSADTIPSPSTSAKTPVKPTKVSSQSEPLSETSGSGAKANINAATSRSSASSVGISRSQQATWSYPRLSASAHPSTELCKALTCASFFAYRDSYPEWSGAQPWFTKPNAVPTTLQGRRDIAWSSSTMYRGDDYTVMGATLFDDLSCLWWRISWNKARPSATVQVDAAYRDAPAAWMDEDRQFNGLADAARGFGDWIAGFAEQSEQGRRPIGDGECWTLAAEAIKYTNQTAQLTPDTRLLTSIGRTHGHLIYAAKADPIKGQCGRWRGGDRMRERWGGIRRGDIIEWRTARCSELNGQPGSYVTLGAPEHTAIVVENSPLPEWMGTTGAKAEDYYTLLGLKPSATQADIRSAYLSAARQHHPDRRAGQSSSHDDDRIRRLNEANETLSDPSRRAKYDAELQSGVTSTRRGLQSNVTRVSASIDLDSMEVVEGQEGDKLTFYHACRCGSGFYVDEDQLQSLAHPIVQCAGCSERVRIVSGQQGDVREDDDADDDDDDASQPALQPWELGSVTTIEQSAGQVPTRRMYDLAQNSFTQGELWIYRPVWEKELLGGQVQPSWPPNLPGWQSIA